MVASMSDEHYSFAELAGNTHPYWSEHRRKVYVASSWRNTVQPYVVQELEGAGHEVYDFKRPNNAKGFAWSDVYGSINHDQSYPDQFLKALDTPKAVQGFKSDFTAMQWADTCVLVLPCERDAHLELGWAVGAGKKTAILLDNPCKASLMYRMVNLITPHIAEILEWMGDL